MPVTVPPSLLIVLQVLRPCFTAPSFVTLAALVTGALSGAGRRTVTGMWQAAGLAGRVHWSRAHRFFARAVWDLDQVGLALARAMVDLLTAALDGRTVHVVGDALYRGPAWRGLPAHITFTTRLAANAVLYGPQPPRTGKRGHPAWKGQRLGSAADMAATTTWTRTRVTRYGTTETVDLAVITCLWWGSLHRTPVRVVLVRDLDQTKPYTLALATTDLTTPAGRSWPGTPPAGPSRWSFRNWQKRGCGPSGAVGSA